jgi:hypothetical protein
MNGRAWVISCCIAVLEVGEQQATGADVAAIAGRLFPSATYPAHPDEGDFELRQFRRHLAFLRDPCVEDPADVLQLLTWAVGHPLRGVRPAQREGLIWLRSALGLPKAGRLRRDRARLEWRTLREEVLGLAATRRSPRDYVDSPRTVVLRADSAQ